MARVNINAFTAAVNNYSAIVNDLGKEIDALSTAAAALRAGISGDEESTQALYSDIEKRQADVSEAIAAIKAVITKVQTTHERYVRDLGILS